MTPEWHERTARRRAAAAADAHERGRELRPIIEKLRGLGFEIESLSDLLQVGRKRYSKAIPVLLSALDGATSLDVTEVLVGVLSVPFAGIEVARKLLTLFGAVADPYLKWSIGNGLEILASEEIVYDLMALALDPRHGRAREMVVLALGKFPLARVGACLEQLLGDADVDGHAALALAKSLGKGDHPQAVAALEPFRDDRRAWVRKAVRRRIGA